MQASTQAPARHTVPGIELQSTAAQALSTQAPERVLQALPVAQGEHMHEVRHTPRSQA